MYEEGGATIGMFGGGLQTYSGSYTPAQNTVIEDMGTPDPYDIPIAYGTVYVEDMEGAQIGTYGGGVTPIATNYYVSSPTVVAGGTVQQVSEAESRVSEEVFKEPVVSGIKDNYVGALAEVTESASGGAAGGFKLGGIMPMLMLMMMMKDV